MYLIFPNDPTTEFLQEVIDFTKEYYPQVRVVNCSASNESYAETLDILEAIPEGGTIFFIGHGSPNTLYGGASNGIEKKSLITLKNVNLFKHSQLILMACNSSDFIKSSRPMRHFSDGLGFGLLPSEIIELQKNRKIRELKLSEEELNKFKVILISLFKNIIAKVANGEKCMERLAFFVSTYLSKSINELIADENASKIAKLLFYIKKDITSG